MTTAKSIYRLSKVEELTSLSRSTIYRLEAQGQFPERIKLSENSTGWYAEEINQWIENRPRVSAGKIIKPCKLNECSDPIEPEPHVLPMPQQSIMARSGGPFFLDELADGEKIID